ncbi:Protein fmp52, mitochondrial [Rhizina undulata]
MTTPTVTAAVVGSTGLVGGHILQQLLALPTTSTVHSLTRRAPPTPLTDPDSKLQNHISTESTAWPTLLKSVLGTNPVSAFFSALGTTRGDAGSLEAQRLIDRDLNIDLAKAAKESGVKTYVLISSNSASSSSSFPYMKMKGELEDAVLELGFDRTIILRPGLIVGSRERTRMVERPLHTLANVMGRVGLKNFWAQDAEVIARAAAKAGLEEETWKEKGKGKEVGGKWVWVMEQADIVEVGLEKK